MSYPLRPFVYKAISWEACVCYGEPHPSGPAWDDYVFLGSRETKEEAEALCAKYVAARPGETVDLGYGWEIVRGGA